MKSQNVEEVEIAAESALRKVADAYESAKETLIRALDGDIRATSAGIMMLNAYVMVNACHTVAKIKNATQGVNLEVNPDDKIIRTLLFNCPNLAMQLFDTLNGESNFLAFTFQDPDELAAEAQEYFDRENDQEDY